MSIELPLTLGLDVVSLVDFWHAAEYLGAAARALEVKRKARAGQFCRWRHALKHEDGAAGRKDRRRKPAAWLDVTIREPHRSEGCGSNNSSPKAGLPSWWRVRQDEAVAVVARCL